MGFFRDRGILAEEPTSAEFFLFVASYGILVFLSAVMLGFVRIPLPAFILNIQPPTPSVVIEVIKWHLLQLCNVPSSSITPGAFPSSPEPESEQSDTQKSCGAGQPGLDPPGCALETSTEFLKLTGEDESKPYLFLPRADPPWKRPLIKLPEVSKEEVEAALKWADDRKRMRRAWKEDAQLQPFFNTYDADKGDGAASEIAAQPTKDTGLPPTLENFSRAMAQPTYSCLDDSVSEIDLIRQLPAEMKDAAGGIAWCVGRMSNGMYMVDHPLGPRALDVRTGKYY